MSHIEKSSFHLKVDLALTHGVTLILGQQNGAFMDQTRSGLPHSRSYLRGLPHHMEQRYTTRRFAKGGWPDLVKVKTIMYVKKQQELQNGHMTNRWIFKVFVCFVFFCLFVCLFVCLFSQLTLGYIIEISKEDDAMVTKM